MACISKKNIQNYGYVLECKETAWRFTTLLMKTYWKSTKEVKHVLIAVWVIKYYCLDTHTMNSLKPWLLKYRALSSELNEFKGTFIFFSFFSCSNLYSLSYCQLFSSKLKSLCWFSGLCGFCFYSSFILHCNCSLEVHS